jgi:uncharacterized OsmC-like protein
MTAADDVTRPGAPPLTYTVHGQSTGPDTEITVGDESISIDAHWAMPPTGLPGPAELLAAAFAACLLKNLARAGQLLDFHYDRAEVDVTARRQDSPPLFVEITYEVRVTTAELPQRIALVHRNLQKYGTVYNTLATVCDVHGAMVGSPPV